MTKVLIAALIVLLPIIFQQGCSAPLATKSATLSSSAGNGQTSYSPKCSTPAGVSGTPKTIEDVVNLINALPKPVTLSCFLESLARPIYANASNSTTSTQPAFSTRSPRIFILIDNLTIAIVPEGPGSDQIELSVMTGSLSLKGEIAFPVTANLSPTAAYDRIRFGTGTSCQTCHGVEYQAFQITGTEAFLSNALRPKPATKVSLPFLMNESLNCSAFAEPKRCEILRGIFLPGSVTEKDLPANLPTLF